MMKSSVMVFAAVALSGCYSPPTASERFENPVVVTTRDEAADFAAYRTFYVRPEVRVLDESAQATGELATAFSELPATTAAPLVEETENNLIARGYVRAATRENADLAVELVYLRSVSTAYYCYYWWDWGYWGYSDWYYYYPDSCSTTAWRSGMLVTHAVDLMGAPPPPADTEDPGVLRGVWFSGVYGVEADSTSYVEDRAIEGIEQAFTQSPYFSSVP
jgi:hypothetical protein